VTPLLKHISLGVIRTTPERVLKKTKVVSVLVDRDLLRRKSNIGQNLPQPEGQDLLSRKGLNQLSSPNALFVVILAIGLIDVPTKERKGSRKRLLKFLNPLMTQLTGT